MSRSAVGVALATVRAIIFGVSATLVGLVIDDIDPFRLASLRIAVAGFVLLRDARGADSAEPQR